MKGRKKIITSVLLITFLCATIAVSATTYSSWRSYSLTLPRFKGDTTKYVDTGNDSIIKVKNKTTAIGGGYDRVKVWIEDQYGNDYTESGKVTQFEGDIDEIPLIEFLQDYAIKVENYSNTYVQVSYSGQYCHGR